MTLKAQIMTVAAGFFSVGGLDGFAGINILQRLPDPVKIFEQESGDEPFAGVGMVGITVNETANTMSHPVENGSTVSDYRVVMPNEIEVHFSLNREDYRNIYQLMKDGFLKGTVYQVQTKAGFYSDLVISKLPHEENADQYDVIPLVMGLKEVLYAYSEIVKISPDDARFAKHSDTKKAGKKQPFTVVRPIEFENGYIKNKDGIQ